MASRNDEPAVTNINEEYKSLSDSDNISNRNKENSYDLGNSILVDKDIVRRQEIRKLYNIGYDLDEIVQILLNGIMINKQLIKIEVTRDNVQNDLDIIKQENLIVDDNYIDKKNELRNKYNFLYKRAMIEYNKAAIQTKNSFLSTAKSILDKLADLEGITSNKLDIKLTPNNQPAKVAEEVEKGLSKDEQSVIDTSIAKILEERKHSGSGELSVVPSESAISAPSCEDEGISRES